MSFIFKPCMLKVSLHMLHLNGRRPLCIVLICISKIASVEYHLEQVLHWNLPEWFPSPCCTFLCLLKWARCTNAQSHLSHLNGLSPVWSRMWAYRKSYRQENSNRNWRQKHNVPGKHNRSSSPHMRSVLVSEKCKFVISEHKWYKYPYFITQVLYTYFRKLWNFEKNQQTAQRLILQNFERRCLI